jgi:hypothetical protein
MAIIDLWGQTESECGICEAWGAHRHAVGWYCGPVKEGIGEPVPEWGPDAVAGGRTVCKACHDRFCGTADAVISTLMGQLADPAPPPRSPQPRMRRVEDDVDTKAGH